MTYTVSLLYLQCKSEGETRWKQHSSAAGAGRTGRAGRPGDDAGDRAEPVRHRARGRDAAGTDSPARPRRRRGPRAGPGRRGGPRYLAPDGGPAVPDARWASGSAGRGTRCPGMDVAGTVVAAGPGVTRFAVGRRGVRHRPRLVRRVRRRAGRQAGPQASRAELRAGRAPSRYPGSPPCRACATPGASSRVRRSWSSGPREASAATPSSSPRSFGAEVTGVCGTAKTDLVRAIGADHVIDYTRADFADGQRRYDLILDIGGNTPLSRLRRALAPRGTLVIAGGEGARWTGVGRQLRALALSPLIRQRLTMFVSRHRPADLDTLRQLTESGPGHPGRRPDLPARRGTPGHPPPARRAGPGQDRHHHLSRPVARLG